MFPRLRPTENAEAQMLKVIEGASIRFTRIGMGNGEEPSVDIEQLTEMQNLICYGTITSYERNGKNAIIHWQLDTASVESAFDWTEYALFAMDENDNEFLFSYSYNVGKVQPIEAAASDSMVMLEMDINITIGDAENVSAIIGEYSAYASKEVVNDHINDKNNPHIVTAEQLGLGNVDNVSTDEARPSFTASNTLQELNSGETASTLFGKLKTAVKSLIDHISNTNNPHKDTPAKIGAAAASHTHNASDINAGVLSVARGGTGGNTGVIVRSNGIGSYSSVTANRYRSIRTLNLPAGIWIVTINAWTDNWAINGDVDLMLLNNVTNNAQNYSGGYAYHQTHFTLNDRDSYKEVQCAFIVKSDGNNLYITVNPSKTTRWAADWYAVRII